MGKSYVALAEKNATDEAEALAAKEEVRNEVSVSAVFFGGW